MATLAELMGAYKRFIPSPAIQAVGLGLGAYGLGRLAYPYTVQPMAKYLGKIPGMTESEALQTLQNPDEGMQWKIPALAGVLAGGASMMSTSSNRGNWGDWLRSVYKWDSNMPKSGSQKKADYFEQDWRGNDQTLMELDKTIPIARTREAIANDPTMSFSEKYTLNRIVDDAAGHKPGGFVELGAVYDKAVDRMDNFFTYKGIADAALRGTLAFAGGKIIAQTLGAVMGFPAGARDELVAAGVIGSIITPIFKGD